ncbi:MAG: hypothetical protein R3B06_15010 [Kofleriaceae bacterium]
MAALAAGREVEVRPRGHSMRGRVDDGQPVMLVPVEPSRVVVGDVVLVRWKGNVLLHLVVAVEDGRLQIGNNLGKINGWVERAAVLGRARLA